MKFEKLLITTVLVSPSGEWRTRSQSPERTWHVANG